MNKHTVNHPPGNPAELPRGIEMSGMALYSVDKYLNHDWSFNDRDLFFQVNRNDIVVHDSDKTLADIYRDAVNGSVEWRGVVDVPCPAGHRHFNLAVEPFRGGALCSACDVTAFVECQRRLLTSIAEAEAERDQRTYFFAAANHDLRQPFQAVRLLQQALVARLGHSDDPMLRRTLDALALALDSGEQLLSALLDVAAIETGSLVPSPSFFPISTVLDDLRHTFFGLAEQKGINLQVNTCNAQVYSDPNLLRRIVWNLVANAIKYTEKGEIVVACDEDGEYELFEVRDTGIGIPPESLKRIFEDFYQQDNPGRNRTLGIGLGLSIVRRLCRTLDHDISVHSELGKGSTFRLKLRRQN